VVMAEREAVELEVEETGEAEQAEAAKVAVELEEGEQVEVAMAEGALEVAEKAAVVRAEAVMVEVGAMGEAARAEAVAMVEAA
jgi:hypothetical protein